MARKPKKEPRGIVSYRTNSSTPEILKQLAQDCGYIYAEEGAPGELFDAIAAIAQNENTRLILIGLLKKT